MVRCNITLLPLWSLCGATYPIRHVAVQHNNPTANMGIWWVRLNRAGNMVRCNITLTPMWVYGAVQHSGAGYAGARVARINPSIDRVITKTRHPTISHYENPIGSVLKPLRATQAMS